MEWILRDVPAWVPAAALTLLMLLAWQVGWLLGWRRQKRLGLNAPDDDKVNELCLTLLALLLAFSFAAAYTKYDARRSHVVDEANAIGTFAIRIQLLPEDVQRSIQPALHDYVDLHVRVALPGQSGPQRREMEAQMRDLQNKITADVLRGIRQAGNVTIGPVILLSLNEMLDQYEIRVAGVVDRVPPAVVGLLVLSSLAGALMVGRRQGEFLKRPAMATVVLLVLVPCVVYVILDLDQPWQGLSRASEMTMLRLAASLGVPH